MVIALVVSCTMLLRPAPAAADIPKRWDRILRDKVDAKRAARGLNTLPMSAHLRSDGSRR